MNKSDISFIFKRGFLGFFWGIIFIPLFIAYFWLKSSSPKELAIENIGVENPYIIGLVIFYGIVGAIYSFVISQIKKTETVIRLMSTDDIKPKDSLILSKKIFKESYKFSFVIFVKYYLIMWIFILCILAYDIGLLSNLASNIFDFTYANNSQPTYIIYSLVITALIVFTSWIYTHFFLSAKIRFFWFTYINHYGENLTAKQLLTEVAKLNKADPNDDKEAMLGYFKRDSALDAGSAVTSAAVNFVAPKSLGSDIVKGYARGVYTDANEYSKMQLNYTQYKKAYLKTFGKNPEISKKLLDLISG